MSKCPYCGKEFKSKLGVAIHISHAHKDLVPPRKLGPYALMHKLLKEAHDDDQLETLAGLQYSLEDKLGKREKTAHAIVRSFFRRYCFGPNRKYRPFFIGSHTYICRREDT